MDDHNAPVTISLTSYCTHNSYHAHTPADRMFQTSHTQIYRYNINGNKLPIRSDVYTYQTGAIISSFQKQCRISKTSPDCCRYRIYHIYAIQYMIVRTYLTLISCNTTYYLFILSCRKAWTADHQNRMIIIDNNIIYSVHNTTIVRGARIPF